MRAINLIFFNATSLHIGIASCHCSKSINNHMLQLSLGNVEDPLSDQIKHHLDALTLDSSILLWLP